MENVDNISEQKRVIKEENAKPIENIAYMIEKSWWDDFEVFVNLNVQYQIANTKYPGTIRNKALV